MDKELLKYMNEVTEYYAGKGTSYSAQDIVNMFLKTPTQEEQVMPEKASVTKGSVASPYLIDFDELNRWKNKNNNKYQVRSHLPITSHRKWIGTALITGKKIVRKFLKWYIDPIVEQQNEFNGSVTASINALANNDIVFNQYIQDQLLARQGNWQEVQDLGQRVDHITTRLDEPNTNNQDIVWLKQQIDSLNEKIRSSEEKHEADLEDLKNEIQQYKEVQQEAHKEIEELSRETEALHKEIEMLNCQTETLNEKIEALHKELVIRSQESSDHLARYTSNHMKEIKILNEENERIQENINYLTYKLNKAKKEGIKVELLKVKEETPEFEVKEDGLDYFLFENKFRGTEKSVKRNQEQYLPYYKGKENVLDIGCGRGEFLELLQENDITAYGIDVYDEFVEYCKDKGMNAEVADALSYIKDQPDNSLGGVFMGQVAEHLDSNYLLSLLRGCYEKMKKGAYFVSETPNPTNLTTFTNSFYLDPTHIKPVHPQTFKFMLEYVGFKQVEIIYTENSKPDYRLPLLNTSSSENLEEFNSGINCVTDVLFGSLDYAVVAKK